MRDDVSHSIAMQFLAAIYLIANGTEIQPVNIRLIPQQNLHLSISDTLRIGQMREIGQFVDKQNGAEVAGQLQPL